MKKDTPRFFADRRLFLKGAAVTGGAVALTAVSATGLVDTGTDNKADPDTTAAATSRGYHETQHIKDFYRALRS